MPDNRVQIRVAADLAAMDAATREAFNNLRVHALEARDAVAAINAKIDELKNEGAVPSALKPLREELLKAQDEVKRTEAAVRHFGKSTEEDLLGARESGRLVAEELGIQAGPFLCLLPHVVTRSLNISTGSDTIPELFAPRSLSIYKSKLPVMN